MTLSFDPRSADWLAAESLAERQEREAGWHWAWSPKPVDEAPRQFLWSFVLAQPLEGGLAARLSGVRGDGTVHFLAPQAQDWQTRQGAPEGWQGSAPNAEWEPARTPAYDLEWRPTAPQGSRLLRRAFDLPGLPTAATLTITALGGYEAEINGQRVGDARLAPENSDFRKRLLVQQHDVKDLLRAGPNVLGALVADGFYASEAIGRGRYPFGEAPRRLWARLEVQLPDGNSHVVATDGQWRTAHGPVTFAEIYHGETHDARLEQAGWSTPGFDDSGWPSAWTAPVPPCELHLQESPPIRAEMTRPAERITVLPSGEHVIDFGQNFAGWCRIHLQGDRRGEAGRTVKLRFAELLNDDGSVDMRNLRAARCTDRYTLRGDGAGETWEPRFTYHGFRYVQVNGWPGELRVGDIQGSRFLADLRASQQPGGAYMDTNPPALPAAGATGWSDAGVVLPHTVWQHYGETTLIDEHWDSMERWNGDTGDLAMNSFNHYALGAITAFLYRRVAGLAAAAPGFSQLSVRPLMDPRLRAGRMSHDSVHGRIHTAWSWETDTAGWFELELPPGLQARVQLPGLAEQVLVPGRHRMGATRPSDRPADRQGDS